MTKIKDKALSKEMRDALALFAKDNVKCPTEQAALDAAYEKVKPHVLAVVTSVFPVKDMKVLAKYGAAVRRTGFNYGGYYDRESSFQFRTETEAPLVPRHTVHDDKLEWPKDVRELMDAYVLARQAHRKAVDDKLRDYRQLITGSRTFNEVVAVWPAAEVLRAKLIPVTVEQKALAVLSAEAIARIKKDNAGANAKV